MRFSTNIFEGISKAIAPMFLLVSLAFVVGYWLSLSTFIHGVEKLIWRLLTKEPFLMMMLL